MRSRTFKWLAVLTVSAGALAYVVSCVNSTPVSTTCPNYCTTIAQVCTGGNAQYPPDNNVTCLAVCAAMEAGTPGVGGANTVACRSLSVANAQDDTSDAAIFNDCINGGVSAANCPMDQCTAFCTLDIALCGTMMTGYEGGVPECVQTCQNWDPTFTPPLIGSTGDSLECRTYHLELSQSGLSGALQTHCPHTGAVSARCFNDAGTDAASDAPDDAPND